MRWFSCATCTPMGRRRSECCAGRDSAPCRMSRPRVSTRWRTRSVCRRPPHGASRAKRACSPNASARPCSTSRSARSTPTPRARTRHARSDSRAHYEISSKASGEHLARSTRSRRSTVFTALQTQARWKAPGHSHEPRSRDPAPLDTRSPPVGRDRPRGNLNAPRHRSVTWAPGRACVVRRLFVGERRDVCTCGAGPAPFSGPPRRVRRSSGAVRPASSACAVAS